MSDYLSYFNHVPCCLARDVNGSGNRGLVQEGPDPSRVGLGQIEPKIAFTNVSIKCKVSLKISLYKRA